MRGQASSTGPALALLLALALTLWAVAAHANPALQAGRNLFTGATLLPARMAGHADALPPAASRCSNCHTAAGLSSPAKPGFGPRLDARHLMQPQPRRGGPASRYDAAALCRALRDGIDPAQVVLPQAMPRYRIDDAGCRALWVFLTAQATP